jgi:hypothetical protein
MAVPLEGKCILYAMLSLMYSLTAERCARVVGSTHTDVEPCWLQRLTKAAKGAIAYSMLLSILASVGKRFVGRFADRAPDWFAR